MPTNSYGEKITKKQADEHFDLVMKIKENSHEKIKEVLLTKGDKNAVRYYCGKEAGFNTDLCFLFSTEILESLLKTIHDKNGKGIAIFNAVRTESDTRKPDDPVGRPTVMMFPFKTTKVVAPVSGQSEESEGYQLFDEDIEILGEDGYEHPGTGGKPPGGAITRNELGNFELPLSFRGSDIWKIV
jgi:hypothetical protein